jgi:hypothetical protein
MAKIELFQAVLNKMLSNIRDDAVDCFGKPPDGISIDDISDEDLEAKAIEYHQKGETGIYLCLLAVLEMRNLNKKMQ